MDGLMAHVIEVNPPPPHHPVLPGFSPPPPGSALDLPRLVMAARWIPACPASRLDPRVCLRGWSLALWNGLDEVAVQQERCLARWAVQTDPSPGAPLRDVIMGFGGGCQVGSKLDNLMARFPKDSPPQQTPATGVPH